MPRGLGGKPPRDTAYITWPWGLLVLCRTVRGSSRPVYYDGAMASYLQAQADQPQVLAYLDLCCWSEMELFLNAFKICCTGTQPIFANFCPRTNTLVTSVDVVCALPRPVEHFRLILCYTMLTAMYFSGWKCHIFHLSLCFVQSLLIFELVAPSKWHWDGFANEKALYPIESPTICPIYCSLLGCNEITSQT